MDRKASCAEEVCLLRLCTVKERPGVDMSHLTCAYVQFIGQNSSNVLLNHSRTRCKIPLLPRKEEANGNIWQMAPMTSRVLLSSYPNLHSSSFLYSNCVTHPTPSREMIKSPPILTPTLSPGVPEDRRRPLHQLPAWLPVF